MNASQLEELEGAVRSIAHSVAASLIFNGLDKYRRLEPDADTLGAKIEADFLALMLDSFPNLPFLLVDDPVSMRLLSSGTFLAVQPCSDETLFENNCPEWGMSVAYIEDGITQFSMIYLPEKDLVFSAIKGKGLKRNKEEFKIPALLDLEILILGLSMRCGKNRMSLLDAVGKVYEANRGVITRTLGSPLADTIEILEGRSHAYLNFDGNICEMAACELLISEGGGEAFQISNEPYLWNQFGIHLVLVGQQELAPLLKDQLKV